MNSRMVVLRLTEQEAGIPSMTAKLRRLRKQRTTHPDTPQWSGNFGKEQEVLQLNNFIYFVSLQFRFPCVLKIYFYGGKNFYVASQLGCKSIMGFE